MTVRELAAVLAQADPDAGVFAVGEDAAIFRVEEAAVWSGEDFDYTHVPGESGDVVIQITEGSA